MASAVAVGKPEAQRDVGAALAAQLGELPGALGPASGHGEHLARACER